MPQSVRGRARRLNGAALTALALEAARIGGVEEGAGR
ncbi:MAG: hypothetical protein QOI83_2735, partial [Streptomycetaceae bacterium]|nr:hypothetical protein [Streptomycetaceae bacterium]